MSALVRQLKDAGVVERIEEKRVAYFRLTRWPQRGGEIRPT
jgi:hypothetical protein